MNTPIQNTPETIENNFSLDMLPGWERLTEEHKAEVTKEIMHYTAFLVINRLAKQGDKNAKREVTQRERKIKKMLEKQRRQDEKIAVILKKANNERENQ